MKVISKDGDAKIVRISEGEALALATAVGYVYSEFDALDTIRLEAGGASEKYLEKIADDLDKVAGISGNRNADG